MTNPPNPGFEEDDMRPPETRPHTTSSDDSDDFELHPAYPDRQPHRPLLGPEARLTLFAATIISMIVIATVLAASTYIQNAVPNTSKPQSQAFALELHDLSQRIARLEADSPLALPASHPATPTPPAETEQPTLPPTAAAIPTPTPTPEPTPAPTPAPAPVPTGHGICGRSPEVQTAILQALGASSCRLVTTAELYRITRFAPATIHIGNGLYLGDFAGLVNIKTLSFDAQENFKLRAGSLEGLTGLETLSLTLHPHGTIEPGTFLGLPSIRNLTITASRVSHEHGLQFSVPPFDHMPNLQTLVIATHRWMPKLNSNHLSKLPDLEQIEIRGRSQAGIYPLPPGLFQDNPRLEEIRIRAEGAAIRAPAGLFTHLDRLQWLYLEHFHTPADRPTFLLSPTSPLMEDILYGEQNLWSYSVVLPDSDNGPQEDR